ncbi:hypothetical protein IHV09_08575 [Fictibacillus sp. 23RED33]|uniref:hypothetical protein n=1 Tax=Fictibacillus sp. 23RED33 TaxID=2745879 RepID=UPI0018CD61B3|nr:hypothetical protein [Fictibacillus sp. 23RED33]MBH0173609.1 hypothetical protein [Fictibacillus sp. 23RED33]
MNKQVGIKFTYYRMGTTISIMTDFENMEDLSDKGLEHVAQDCIDEVYRATELDLTKLSQPYPATQFCFFSELSYHSDQTITEKNRTNVISTKSEKKELVY